jgi:lysozyme
MSRASIANVPRLVSCVVSVIAAAGAFACSGGSSENTGNTADELVACASGPTVEGVDVSEFQGSVAFDKVKASGRHFAFIRVSDGLGHLDSTFHANWGNAKNAGVIRGVYQFFRPEESATAQADLLLSHMGNLEAGDLPPVLDVEVTDGVSHGNIRAGIDAWSARIKQVTGRTPIVYTAPGFWPSVGGATESDELWVADWGVSCPSLPSSWHAWKFWQNADNGSVPGIGGQVDVDRFNGTLADLQQFADAKPPPVPAAPPVPAGCGEFKAGEGLSRGQSHASCDGRFRLDMQTDGNLVLYENPSHPLWATRSNGVGYIAVMQADGNFVEYDDQSAPVWASGTSGHDGSTLRVQDDGNLVVYGPQGHAWWASDTCCH